MTVVPKEFIAVCIKTFEKENNVFWIPAGRPCLIMFKNSLLSILNFFRLILQTLLSWLKHIRFRMAAIVSDIIVAYATPSIPIPRGTTNIIFIMIFNIPDIVRK